MKTLSRNRPLEIHNTPRRRLSPMLCTLLLVWCSLPPLPFLSLSSQSNISSNKELADAIIWIGLARGGTATEKPPGNHSGSILLGSIGFSLNGSVYLDGIQLVLELGRAQWRTVNKVVGCGFDPKKKTVFFTMDTVLLHVIHYRFEAFAGPLYLALAANNDAAVLVNLGQCALCYPLANAQHTPNPCFLRPSTSAHIHYDDSRKLFSMGRISSQWQDVVSGGKAHQVNSVDGLATSEEDDRGNLV